MPALTDLGRRVLSHLPDWAEDEAAFVKMEGGPEVSIRFYTLPDFTARLAEDIYTKVDDPPRSLTEDECKLTLDALIDAGLASEKDGEYRMTEAGRDALTAPEGKTEQVPGAVLVELAPARVDSGAKS